MLQDNISKIKEVWIDAIQSPKTRSKILVSSVLTIIILTSMPVFFRHIEQRQGAVLNDWVLAYLPPHNVSIYIFAIIWGMGALILYRALYNPHIYIKYSWTLIFVNLTRMLTITLFALDPPKGMVHLIDPITGIFYGNAVITKDLFFSGHTSTLVLIALCLEKRRDKLIGVIALVAVMILLLVQHIHYTIDVLAAPIIVYVIYLITRYLLALEPSEKISGHQ